MINNSQSIQKQTNNQVGIINRLNGLNPIIDELNGIGKETLKELHNIDIKNCTMQNEINEMTANVTAKLGTIIEEALSEFKIYQQKQQASSLKIQLEIAILKREILEQQHKLVVVTERIQFMEKNIGLTAPKK